MKILEKSKDLTPQEIYFLTKAPSIQKMSDQDGQIIEVHAFAVHEDTNAKGEVQEILSIMSPDREVFATNSKTFKHDFIEMVNLFESMDVKVEAIKVISGESKAGRTFYTCVYER